MADVLITLNVDTSQISVQNVDPFCNFGQGPGISNEDFLTVVDVGDTVIWEGVSSVTASDTVNITNINHTRGSSVFNSNNLTGNGRVSGAVRSNAHGEQEKYTIMFTVFNNGIRRPGTFSIDPKIQVNQ